MDVFTTSAFATFHAMTDEEIEFGDPEYISAVWLLDPAGTATSLIADNARLTPRIMINFSRCMIVKITYNVY